MGAVMTVELLEAFNQAWGRADVPALMSFITDNCIYHASVGPEPGATFAGRIEVKKGFTQMLAHDEGSEGKTGRCIVIGDIGISEWSYVTMIEGRTTEVRGCDIFEFEGDMIKRKDAFRKVFG